MLKVLHLLWDGNLGGVQRYVLKVVGAEHWKDVEHGICFLSKRGEVLSDEKLPRVKFFSLGLKRGWDLLGARRLDKIVREFDPQVIHCHCDTPAFALRIKNFTDRRLVYTEHGDTIMRTSRTWFMNWLWRRSGPFWNAILLNSEFVKRDFLKRFPFLEESCTVFPNPLIEIFHGERHAPDANHPRVGVFGRLVQQKGMDWMLEVAALARKQVPNLRVEFFGDGPLREKLEALSEKMNLGDCVDFMGYVSDPLTRMSQMTCTAVPSRIEPFGLVALEAQGAGVPVVGFTESGVAEIIEDRKTGRIVPHGNLHAMAEAIVEIVKDRALADSMGHAARERALSVFSLERHVENLERVYQSRARQ